MKCPNCHTNLDTDVYDNIEINHCPSCGGTFFDSNEINRISLETARELSTNKRSDSLSGGEKFCPRDQNIMTTFKADSVPQHVTILKCDSCGGAFAFADDLVEFKSAQEVKINYFKIWRIPMPAMRTVLVTSFIAILSLSALTANYMLLQKPQTTFIQAETICSRLQIINNENGYLAFCDSETPVTSKAKLFCDSGEREIIVSKAASTIHSIQVGIDCTAIQFIFEDNGQSLETEIMPLGNR